MSKLFFCNNAIAFSLSSVVSFLYFLPSSGCLSPSVISLFVLFDVGCFPVKNVLGFFTEGCFPRKNALGFILEGSFDLLPFGLPFFFG